jgi:hypothetical protein
VNALSSFFRFGSHQGSIGTETEMPEIFPFPFIQDEFVAIDVLNIYTKILTDVVERTHGLSDDEAALLWDNCLKSSKSDGLVTLLAKAMSDKKELFLVYVKSVKVIREADSNEQQKIKEGYASKAEKVSLDGGGVGVYISFKNFKRSDMVKLYSSLEYATISSLYKNMNVSKSIQLKMSDMRQSTGLSDSVNVTVQAKMIAKGMSEGKDVLLDAKDSIETAKPELDSTKSAIAFLDAKRSFYLGMPTSYINGEQTGGLGSTGEGDAKAVDRGLKSYFFSIVKPVLEDLFGGTITFKSSDYRQLGQALEAMKVFELVGEDLLTKENQKKIIEQLVDIDADDNDLEKDVTNTVTGDGTGTALPVAGATGEKVSDTALNGAQVASMISIVEKVAAGLIPREAGIQIMKNAFLMSDTDAAKVMGNAGAGFVATPKTPAAQPPAVT